VSFSEWELMCIAEDIEPGDTVIIENLKDHELIKLVIYTGMSEDDQWIYCKEFDTQQAFIFNAASLDEKGKRTKQWRLLRKSTVDMRFKQKIICF
jgi:hypothetical protein